MTKRKKHRHQEVPAIPTRKRGAAIVVVSVLAVVIVPCLGFWWSTTKHADEKHADESRGTPVPVAAQATIPPATAVAPQADLQRLKGQWLRPDGGYVLAINNVADSGKLDATYINPRPINVAKAEASQEGETIKVFIELRDKNYPGSTYDLTYDPQADSLAGIYYQAALQQQFEVAFRRIN